MTTTTTPRDAVRANRTSRRDRAAADIRSKVPTACEAVAARGPVTPFHFGCDARLELSWICTPYRVGGEFADLAEELIGAWIAENTETVPMIRKVAK